jgi:DNA-binding NtrC family response regulator
MEQLRILVVDDETTIRHVLKRVLQKRGCELREAGSGEEALPIVDTWRPDIALLDISMPGMSGLQLLELIKGRVPETTVVMMTSYTSVEVLQQAIRGGAADFLPKPFALADVWTTLERALEQRLAAIGSTVSSAVDPTPSR